MTEAFIGEVRMFGFTYPPEGWAQCNGQLVEIAQNQALYAILGITYGGNGRTNFGIPDFKGRAPMHFGNGPGLTPRILGQTGGSPVAQLTSTNLPLHNHDILCDGDLQTGGSQSSPVNAVPAVQKFGRSAKNQFNELDPQEQYPTMKPVSTEGGDQLHENRSPFQVVQMCICLDGVFPPRN